MAQIIPSYQIDRLILGEFKDDKDPIQHTYQAQLTAANQANRFRDMAEILEKVGDYFSRKGKVQETVRLYLGAIHCLSKSPDEPSLKGIGQNLDDIQKAFRSEKSIVADVFQMDQEPPDPNDLGHPLNIRLLFKAGTAMLLQGQDEPASEFYDKAIELKEKEKGDGDRKILWAKILTNRGVIQRKRHDLEAARQNLDSALKIFGKHQLRAEEGKVLSIMAGVEHAEALEEREKARLLSIMNDADYIQTPQEKILYKKAWHLYKKAMGFYETPDNRDMRGKVRTYTGAGLLCLDKKQFKRAFDLFEKAKIHTNGLEILDLVWPIQWGLACCYLSKKDYKNAEAQLGACIGHIERFQDNLCSDEGKATFIESVQFVYSRMFEVLIGCQRKSRGDFSQLLDFMERSRAQSLRDMFSANKGKMQNNKNPITDRSGDVYPSSPLSDTRATNVPDVALHRLVIKILPKHTVIVVSNAEGVLHGRVLRKGIKAWENDLDAFRNTIGRSLFSRDVLDFPNLPGTEAFSFQKLYQAVIKPVEKWLPKEGELLLIEPDGPFWQIPLHLIPMPDGRNMGDVWPMIYTPSFEIYQKFKKKAAPPILKEDQFFFGGISETHTWQDTRYAPLKHTLGEVTTIANDIIGTANKFVFSNEACTKANALVGMPGSRIVHLATHGQADAQNPLDSYLALWGQPLQAEELVGLHLANCELVTLSACKSGLGRVMSEGMVGLARAFQLAGARTLLVSLWSVEDESAFLMMRSFYENLVRLGDKARALQAAMHCVRNMPGKEDPKFWAPFVLIGVEDCKFQI